MIKEFQADLARYRELGISTRDMVLNPAIWAILWYRFGRWIYKEGSPRLIRPLLKVFHVIGTVYLEAFMQMRLNPSAEIGPGPLIAHCGGITLHHRTVIGNNCDLAHHVTIGTPGIGRTGVPRIGNSVYIGTGAVIIGGIQVGDGARIAANSLVNRDVPPGATVIGVPAQIVKLAEPSRESQAASQLPASEEIRTP
jgi:serine O-acetyltransferase